MIFADEQELPCHSAGQLLFCHGYVHKKLLFNSANLETNIEKYGVVLYNDVCTHKELLFLCRSTQKLSWEICIMTDFYKLLNDLQLPPIHKSHGKEYYVDPFRERLILKTPEETVRQQVLQYLLSRKNIPKEMIQVEMRLSKYQVNSARRADIIVERFNGNKGELSPLAIIECKAPEIMIGDSAIQQVIDYADALNADYIFVTNGDYAMIAKYEADSNQYVLLNELPDYQSMLCGQGDCLPENKPKERFAFDTLNENKDYYRGYEFNPDTPSELLPF